MVKSRIHIAVDEEVLEILNKCAEDFLDNNPKFVGMKLSKNFIVRKIGEYYLDN
jgi:hypothetical protein